MAYTRLIYPPTPDGEVVRSGDWILSSYEQSMLAPQEPQMYVGRNDRSLLDEESAPRRCHCMCYLNTSDVSLENSRHKSSTRWDSPYAISGTRFNYQHRWARDAHQSCQEQLQAQRLPEASHHVAALWRSDRSDRAGHFDGLIHKTSRSEGVYHFA